MVKLQEIIWNPEIRQACIEKWNSFTSSSCITVINARGAMS